MAAAHLGVFAEPAALAHGAASVLVGAVRSVRAHLASVGDPSTKDTSSLAERLIESHAPSTAKSSPAADPADSSIHEASPSLAPSSTNSTPPLSSPSRIVFPLHAMTSQMLRRRMCSNGQLECSIELPSDLTVASITARTSNIAEANRLLHLPYNTLHGPRHRNLNKHSLNQKRCFWSERRLLKLESEANDPVYSTDARRQADLYRELMQQGNFRELIHRYEHQPQLPQVSATYSAQNRRTDALHVQQDTECLRLYAAALVQEGQVDRLVDKITNIVQQKHSSMDVGGGSVDRGLPTSGNFPPSYRPPTVKSPWSTPDPPPAHNSPGLTTEPRLHWMSTNLQEWERAIGYQNAARVGPSTGLPTSNSGQSTPPPGINPDQPIQVVMSEAWSWSKFTRKLGSNVLFGVILITGLGLVLDQQGIIKSAGINTPEMEPTNNPQPIRFADVQGVDEAKLELEEIVAFLKEPKRFNEVGGKLPKGILLYGPPGTGKTHLARAVAGEAGVPFFQMSGSEFDELYVGVGARRVRELFAAARKKAPCIVFIDEIDAVGSKRSAKDQSYMRQTLNQLLVELDGFSSSEGVIFIAATNTPEALDKALIRPGRFDRHVVVPLPDVQGRTKILEVHSKDVQLSKEIDLSIIARGTPGFSGADLANLINQAAIKASKDGYRSVRMLDLEWAKDKIIMGSERKSAVITEQNKRLTAYHEGGHTLVALYTPGAMPLHKVTVIPRGNALGVTVQLPEGDKTNHTRKELLAMLDVCMGGRVAEEMIFGAEEVTTGAASDLEKATAIAREMVMLYGMGEQTGYATFSGDEYEKMSTQTKIAIEAEVKSLLQKAYSRAETLLRSHKEELHRLSRALVEHETLSVEEVQKAIKGGDIRRRPSAPATTPVSGGTGNGSYPANGGVLGGPAAVAMGHSPSSTASS